jgi:hypothetical protein
MPYHSSMVWDRLLSTKAPSQRVFPALLTMFSLARPANSASKILS